MKTLNASIAAILVVDDDPEMAGTLQELLQQDGYEVAVALTADEALIQQQRSGFAMALVDLIMSPTDGLSLMEQLHRNDPNLAIVIMTGFGTIETAVEALKRGAEDYLTKPFDREAVRKKTRRLMELFGLRQRVAQLEASLDGCLCFESFVYVSRMMQRVVERAHAAAASDAPVLLVGETGTGKEMLARAIHAASPRSRKPFVPINCGALPRELVESELFGFRRGAFTGAHADAPGIFAAANGGTVFLDEIAEMPKEAQVKLLRVIQEGELRPVGSPKPVTVDVRIVSASNRPLSTLRAESLREDLYFRITTIVVELPPLRAHPEDIPVLAQSFMGRLGRRYGRQIRLTSSAVDILRNYPFPGNVRELENVLEGVVALSVEDPQVITDRHLRPLLNEAGTPAGFPGTGEQVFSMEQMERFAIQQALRLCRGNHSKAASLLGISRDTLYRKLRKIRDAGQAPAARTAAP